MSQKSTIGRILKYLSRYKVAIIVSLVLALATVAGQLAIPVLQGRAIDRIVGAGNVDFKGIMQIILIILITVMSVAVFQWIMNVINNKINLF